MRKVAKVEREGGCWVRRGGGMVYCRGVRKVAEVEWMEGWGNGVKKLREVGWVGIGGWEGVV